MIDCEPLRDAAPGAGVSSSAGWVEHEAAMGALLGEIEALERRIRRLQGDQLEAVAAFVAARVAFDEAQGLSADAAQTNAMAAEVAIAKRVSVGTAHRLLDDAYTLTRSLPATMAALRRGDIAVSAATVIAAETGGIDDPVLLAAADRRIAAEAAEVAPGKVRVLAERVVADLDAGAAAVRHRRARRERRVSLSPAGEAMMWLNAYLPAEQALACWHSLHEHAISRYTAGDTDRSTAAQCPCGTGDTSSDAARAWGADGGSAGGDGDGGCECSGPVTVTQLMADSLVERVTGAATDAIPAQVSVIMTDATLLGTSDQPAHLAGAGPLPADAARLLATTGSAWLRRFLTDPVDGSASIADTGRRRFDQSLREAVTVRDHHCRGINCTAPIRDIDHITTYAAGGATTMSNGQGLSKGCHRSRDHPRMHVTRNPDTGVVEWATPSGLTHRSLPPPALGHGSTKTHQQVLRQLLLHPPQDSALERHTLTSLVRHLRRGP